MPEDVGTRWTYSVRTGFGAEHVEDIRIARHLSVAGTRGFEMIGPMGSSRLAWREGALWADRFSNVGFEPPIPLLRADRRPAEWKGKWITPFGTETATGTLKHSTAELSIDGMKFSAVVSELSFARQTGTTTLTTWFAPGTGIVRQEQRARGTLELRLQWVAGPNRG